nr:MAG TPA: tail protein [Caudoviricetes sp.]
MMALDVSKVLVGAPDQATTGAILDAPLGSKLPASASDELDAAFVSSGYVSEDGLALTTDRSTNDIKDWSSKVIRKLLDSFDATIKWSEIQMSYEALCHAFGAENVMKTAASSSHGEQVRVAINGAMPQARSWAFKMKDGNARILIVVPNGQVTSVDEIDFVASDGVKLPITLSCYPDASGNSIYIYTDDGVVSK